MTKIVPWHEAASVGEYAVVGDVLAIAVPISDVSECEDCCFLPTSSRACKAAPGCGSTRVKFEEVPKTSDEYLLARLKGEV